MLAEAQLMRETGGKSKVEWALWSLDFVLPHPHATLTLPHTYIPSKVKWTDIDGNLYNDAVWLKPPFD